MAKKILVADDSLTIQKVIRLALSDEGYDIHAVSDGNDIIEEISLFRPEVILIDASLPGKSATQVLEEVGRHRDLKSIRFIVMSSAFDQSQNTDIKAAGFSGQLIKPFDPAHLRNTIQEALADTVNTNVEPPPFVDTPTVSPELAPDTSAPMGDDLWDEPPPAPAGLSEFNLEPPEPFPANDDDEIQKLTESTMKMSNERDDSWTINDIGSKSETDNPQLKPSENYLDMSGTSFETLGIESSDLPPVPPRTNTSSDDLNFSTAYSQDEMKQLVKEEVGRALREMAEKMLPDIAERIIREEIRQMLSNPPSTK